MRCLLYLFPPHVGDALTLNNILFEIVSCNISFIFHRSIKSKTTIILTNRTTVFDLCTVLKSSLTGDWSVNKRNPKRDIVSCKCFVKAKFHKYIKRHCTCAPIFLHVSATVDMYTCVYMFNMSITINYFIELFL